jgi:hypothetical protein
MVTGMHEGVAFDHAAGPEGVQPERSHSPGGEHAEDRNRVANWVTEQKVTPLVLLDSDGAVAQLYGVTGTPTVVLIGRQGEMIGRAVSSREWTGEKGRGLFEALLSPQAR